MNSGNCGGKLRGKGMPGVRAVAAVGPVKVKVGAQHFAHRVKAATVGVNPRIAVRADVHSEQHDLQSVASLAPYDLSVYPRPSLRLK